MANENNKSFGLRSWGELNNGVENYRQSLLDEEMKESTIKKYLRDIRRFLNFAETYLNIRERGADTKIDKSCVITYKNELKCGHRPASVNSYLTSLNRYFRWLGEERLTVKLERIQKKCSLGNVLTRQEYQKLLDYAVLKGKMKYFCIMKTLGSTGIRVGELQYITYEAVENRAAMVDNKGKIREICIPDSLCDVLRCYCEEYGIHAGIIFYGRQRNKPLDITGIWKALKRIAAEAGVDPEKVYPHSFRHLFAKTYMNKVGNLTVLSDILGHTSVETTRIYTMGTIEEKRESMSLVEL